MARQDASDLARNLGRQAEAVCRHYLSTGRREGRYWLVGDVRNTPDRSMYVRLKNSPKGVAGKWTDAATGEHGDLLDVIRESCGLIDFKDVADEARSFLSMPPPEPEPRFQERQRPAPSGSPEAARRLIGMSLPITGTIVQAYLRERGITDLRGTRNLRFHPRCHRRQNHRRAPNLARSPIARQGADRHAETSHGRPARQRGALRRRWRGDGGRRRHRDRLVAPPGASDMPMLAALSAAHLAASLFHDTLRRLYIVRDDDPAGDSARDSLIERANTVGIEAIVISALGDFNEDLRALGIEHLRQQSRMQIAPQNLARFVALAA